MLLPMSARTKIGTLPVLVLIVMLWIYLGWNFPGYCDRGDGLRCTGPGLVGLADSVLGFRSGGPFAGIALIVCGIALLLFLTVWSWIAVSISKIPRIGVPAIVLIYFLMGSLALTWAFGVKWEPKFVGEAWRGYIPESSAP